MTDFVQPLLLTYKEAAQRLHVSVMTVRRMVEDDTLKPVRLRGRVLFRPADLDRLMGLDAA